MTCAKPRPAHVAGFSFWVVATARSHMKRNRPRLTMRKVLFAGLSAVGLLAIAITSSPGFARTRMGAPARAAVSISPAAIQDRYCLQSTQWGYPGNCEFSTYDQCLATASGTDAFCGINPQYLFADQWRDYRPRY